MTDKVTLEFTLESPRDKLGPIRALKATDAYLALLRIKEEIHAIEQEGREFSAAKALEIVECSLDRYAIDLFNELE